MTFRPYNQDNDIKAVARIWREIGWIERDEHEEILEYWLTAGRTLIAEVDGQAECMVNTMPSDLRYVDEDLPMSCVTGVATSRVVRKQGLAGRLTAMTIAEDVAQGAIIASLGIFDQGYYDRLGFGNGPYDRWQRFDPDSLKVEPARRSPRRLTRDDWELVHNNRMSRLRGHGSCNLFPSQYTRGEMQWTNGGFGLGFCDGPDGELSHHIWLATAGNAEYGPYNVRWIVYETHAQFIELLGVLKNLGDQVHGVRMVDPPGIQMQMLLDTPFRNLRITDKSKYEASSTSISRCQYRICDLMECMKKTSLRGDYVRFNLSLTDPITNYLPDEVPWRGVEGDYVVTLGPSSGAELGRDDSLPTMNASVNAFTRLWLGVQCPTGMIVTDDLTAPGELLEELDWLLRLPKPQPDWDF